MTVQAGQRWRHWERGTVYEIIGFAMGQGGTIEDRPVVIYRGEDCQTWARTTAEFVERFEPLVDPQDTLPITTDAQNDLAGLARREQPPPPNLADYTDIGSGHPPRGRIGIP